MFRILLFIYCFQLSAATKPDLLLAQVYHNAIDVQQYWISEKLDGVRAFWNGQQLMTRGGQIIAAPAWF
ncbi:MAG: DNA ligase, partial [Gammaproteobacteria bacterium]|nr:DNA ligase [Gammaproteobacteria bacterium]